MLKISKFRFQCDECDYFSDSDLDMGCHLFFNHHNIEEIEIE